MSLGRTACLLPWNHPAFWGRDSWNSKAERGVKGREGDGDERLREGPYVWKRTSPRFFINVIRKYATAVFTSSGLGFCSSMQSLMKVPAQLQSLFFPLHVPLLIQIQTAVNITRSMFSVTIPHARPLSAQWFSGMSSLSMTNTLLSRYSECYAYLSHPTYLFLGISRRQWFHRKPSYSL